MRKIRGCRQPLLAVVVMTNVIAVLLGIAAARAQGPNPQLPQAAVGPGFSYQGLLQKSNQALNDTCQLTFSLWDSQSNGTGQLGSSQVANTVAVTNGVFSVLLNGGGQFGPSAFDGSERWLAVSVQCTGDSVAMTLPRQQIASAPYALRALSVPNGSITTTMLANGSVTAAKLGLDVALVPPDGSITSRKMNATEAYYLNSNLGSTTATTPGDLSDGVDIVTITLQITQWVNIDYSAVAFSDGSSNKIHYLELGFDGVADASGDSWVETDTYDTLSGFYHTLLSAGTHTIALKYHVPPASGGTGHYFRRRIHVYVISQ